MSNAVQATAKQDLKALLDGIVERHPDFVDELKQRQPRIDLAMALVTLRRQAGKTQKQVAALMGKDQSFISKMESASGPFPDTKSVAAFARACESAFGYVFVQAQVSPDAGEDTFAVSMSTDSELFSEVMAEHNIPEKNVG